MDSNKLQRLKEILNVANQDVPSTKEVANLISQIIKAVKDSQSILRSEIESGKSDANSTITSLKTRLDSFESWVSTLVSKSVKETQDKAYKQLNSEVYKLEQAIRDIPQFNSDGLETKWSIVVKDIQNRIDNIKPFIPQAIEIRDLLETLKDDERLDISAIKGFKKLNQSIQDEILMRATSILDSRTSYLINKLTTLQNQVNNLPSGGGGSSSYQQPLTGGLTGTNTWATAPNVIVVDGAPMQKVQTDGTVNWTGTTTTVLQTRIPSFDIFASA